MRIILAIGLLLITGCGAYERRDCYWAGKECIGRQGPPGSPGDRGESGDRGMAGPQGQPGANGNPGQSGSDGAPGSPGEAGEDGAAGTDGAAGVDGYSIVTLTETIAPLDYFCSAGGVRIRIAQDTNRNNQWDASDAGQQLASICNGADGEDGEDGADAPPTPFSPVGMVDPCGDKPGVYDEVFIRLANGTLLASFSDNANGLNTRFSVLSTGSYVTTDNSHCYFSVDSNNQLYNEHY